MQPDYLVNQCGNFEVYSIFDRQPIDGVIGECGDEW